jgi:hypothetical protein
MLACTIRQTASKPGTWILRRNDFPACPSFYPGSNQLATAADGTSR